MTRVQDFKNAMLVFLGVLFLNSPGFAAPTAAYGLGEQKTLVLLLNFQDNTSQPMTLAQANDVVFVKSNNFFKENSFGKTFLSGNVFGWYTLPMSQVNCSVNNIAVYAQQAATAAGIDVSKYNRYVYVVSYSDTCHPAVGVVGGQTSTLWLSTSTLTLGYFTHEFGHNLGLLHSYTLDCGTSVLGNSCTRNPYGDVYDGMGGTSARHFNAFQKERLGWLNYTDVPSITTVSSSGTYTIEAYETNTLGAKALKIVKSIDPISGVKTYYYVELRQAIGFDSAIPSFAPTAVNGVLIHTGKEDDPDSSNLLDMTPGSALDYTDWTDAALAVGKTYTDATAGISISLVSLQNGIATVNVSIGSATTCTLANPSLVLSPAAGPQVTLGTSVTYTVSVKNNNSSACPQTTFNVRSLVPAGWTSSVYSPSLTLASGASASTTFYVISSGSSSGTYDIGVSAVNSANSSYVANVSGTYTIGDTCVRANPTVSISSSISSSVAPGTLVLYSVSVKNNDSSTCSASIFSLVGSVPSGWSSSLSSSSLSLSPGETGSSTFSVTSSAMASAGTYGVSINAANSSASAFNSAASASYSVASISVLSAAVKTDKSVYIKGSTVTITSTVMSGGIPIAGVAVTITIVKPNGSISSLSAITNSSGQAIATIQIPKNKTAVGSYEINIKAVSGTQSASAATSFSVE